MDAVGWHGRRVGKNGSLLQCGERSLRLFLISGLSHYLQCVTWSFNIPVDRMWFPLTIPCHPCMVYFYLQFVVFFGKRRQSYHIWIPSECISLCKMDSLDRMSFRPKHLRYSWLQLSGLRCLAKMLAVDRSLYLGIFQPSHYCSHFFSQPAMGLLRRSKWRISRFP